MPRFRVPVNLELHVGADSPSHAYSIVQSWFQALLSDDYDGFIRMRSDGTIFPSNWQMNEEEMTDMMTDRIESRHTQRQLDEQRAKWQADEE